MSLALCPTSRSPSTVRVGVPSSLVPIFTTMSEPQSDLVNASDRILRSEHATLTARLGALERRLELHRGIVHELEVEFAVLQRLLREIDELSDRRPQLRIERLDKQLKGRRIQEVAIELLRRRLQPEEVVHYREWFGMLTAEGFEIAGRDPLNTFLTSVGRADGVVRVGRRSGLYRLA